MPTLAPIMTAGRLQDLFDRRQFSELIRALAQAETHITVLEVETGRLPADALIDLHQVLLGAMAIVRALAAQADQRPGASLAFDPANKRILLSGQWLPLHARPLLFQFLQLLHARATFVDKASIARDLWPTEAYRPRVHDPRIFDIAKRARGLMEVSATRLVTLLSGRQGYKLSGP